MIQLNMMLQTLSSWITDRLSREEGQDFVEYAVILAVVVVIAAAAYLVLGNAITTAINKVVTSLTGAA